MTVDSDAVLQPRMIIFTVPKAGNSEAEWEDGAATDLGAGGSVRVAIADGASSAYGSRRWANNLVSSFTSPHTGPAALDISALRRWFSERQDAWTHGTSRPGTVVEELKVAEGSFATFVGCVLSGLDGPAPGWEAVALGDSVLFHVRDAVLEAQVPRLDDSDFGRHPDGAHTRTEALPQMAEDVVRHHGSLRPQDHLFLATDALAQWIVRRRNHRSTWDFLAALSHPRTFALFVAEQRDAGELTNDDVTLVRVLLSSTAPKHLVVCR